MRGVALSPRRSSDQRALDHGAGERLAIGSNRFVSILLVYALVVIDERRMVDDARRLAGRKSQLGKFLLVRALLGGRREYREARLEPGQTVTVVGYAMPRAAGTQRLPQSNYVEPYLII